MKYKISFLLVLVSFFFCCKKENIENQSTPNLKLLWKEYRGDDRISGCAIPVLTEHGIIYSQDFYLGEDKSKFFLFDKNTGEIKWEWSDYNNEGL